MSHSAKQINAMKEESFPVHFYSFAPYCRGTHAVGSFLPSHLVLTNRATFSTFLRILARLGSVCLVSLARLSLFLFSDFAK